MCPVKGFFAVETNMIFWCDLESLDKKVWPVTHFFRSADCLQFLMGLRKISTKMCAQLHVFSLWRLSEVFDGTWTNFHKKVCSVICFLAVETNLRFWWDLEKFSQKSVPSHMFLRCGDYLKFLRGLGKFRQKGVTSYTVFRSADYLKFLMGLGKSFIKKCAQSHVSSLWRLS